MGCVHDFKEFCNATGIKALNFMIKSGSPFEQLFWAISIATCVGLTIWDVTETVNKYLSYPTSAKITLFNNQTIDFEQPLICFDLEVEKLPYSNLRLDNNLDVMILLSQFDEYNITAYLQAELKLIREMRQNGSKYEFDDQTVTLISLTTAMLTSLTRREVYAVEISSRTDLSFNFGLPMSLSDSQPYRTTNTTTTDAITAVYQFYMKKNVDMWELKQNVGSFLCELYQLTLTKIEHKVDRFETFVDHKVCSQERINYLGIPTFYATNKEILCMKSPEGQFAFKYRSESVKFTFDSNKIRSKNGSQLWAYLSLLDKIGITPRSPSLIAMRFEANLDIRASLNGHHIRVHTPRRPCSDVPIMACKIGCRTRYTIENCGCFPLTMLSVAPKPKFLPYCGQTSTSNVSDIGEIPGMNSPECRLINKLFDPDTKCADECILACENKLFSVSIVNNLTPKPPGVTEISFGLDMYVYPIFEEIYLMEAKQFMATLGGNLSFWLGASFLVLIHMIVFFARGRILALTGSNKTKVSKATGYSLENSLKTFNKK